MTRLRISLAVLGLAIAFTLSACSNSSTTSAGAFIGPIVNSMVHACRQAGATKAECGCAVKYVQDHYKTGSLTTIAEFQAAMKTAVQSCATGS